MTDIAIAKNLTPATLEDLERRILQAEAEGDAGTLAQYVPQHEAYYAMLGAASAIQRALDDWRIVHFHLHRFADCSSANQYFVRQARESAFAQAPSTRLGNAHAIDFFYREQGWSIEELFRAGIEKLRRWVYEANQMVEREGSLDPLFKEVMLDPEIPVARVYRRYWDTRKAWDHNPDEPIRDDYETWSETVYSYSEPVVRTISGVFFELVAWKVLPDGNHVACTIGHIDAGAAETWARVLDGKVKLVAR
jgi:hypothetical protein